MEASARIWNSIERTIQFFKTLSVETICEYEITVTKQIKLSTINYTVLD